jgi:hypothetical protein
MAEQPHHGPSQALGHQFDEWGNSWSEGQLLGHELDIDEQAAQPRCRGPQDWATTVFH